MSDKSLNHEEFSKLWNDLENYPTLRSIAQETGYTYEYVRNKGKRIRRAYEEGRSSIVLTDRSGTPSGKTILPELRFSYRAEMTAEDCLTELRDLQSSDPSRHITLNYFRNVTEIADSTWTRYFGTFLEYRRQAGLEMNRNQHQVQRQVAKHVSVDHYREFNERSRYADRYLKPAGGKVKTIIGCSDLHDIETDPFYLRVFIETCRIAQPDVVNFGGDIFDLAEFGKYGVDPREWDVVGRIQYVHEHIFKPLREACPDAQMDFVEGNHEYRLLRHLADATPALKAILSDLLGLTVPKLLGLDEFEINYIAKGDLAAYTKGDQTKEVGKSYVVYDEALIVHHHPHAAKFGLPGWNGHHHHWKVDHYKSALRGGYKWLQLGCGHRTNASYCEGEFWDMGFVIAHINTESKSVTMEYNHITDIACVGGLYFERQPNEMVGFYASKDKKFAA